MLGKPAGRQVYTLGGTVTTTRYYFGGAYETVAETSTAIKYYNFAGQTLASRFPTSAPALD